MTRNTQTTAAFSDTSSNSREVYFQRSIESSSKWNWLIPCAAARKAFATIEGAGHFALFTKQDAFLNELRARVLPLIR